MRTTYFVLSVALLACKAKSTVDPGPGSAEKVADKAPEKAPEKDKAPDKAAAVDDTEATIQLSRIGKLAKVAFIEQAAYPTGHVGPTPATSCCEQPDKHCKPDAAAWSDPVWKKLDFEIADPSTYQYAYESDGKGFTATATGCDGAKHTITGTSVAGSPEVQMQ